MIHAKLQSTYNLTTIEVWDSNWNEIFKQAIERLSTLTGYRHWTSDIRIINWKEED